MQIRQKYTEVKDFEHFICHLSIIPLYEKPGFDEYFTGQLLFGETGTIIAKKNKHWCKIKSDHLQPEAWVHTDQITLIPEKKHQYYSSKIAYLAEINHTVLHDQNPLSLLMGACLRGYDGISFQMPDGKYICNGTVVIPEEIPTTREVLLKICRRYLYAPYLRGGRSPYGIDPFNMIQLVFRNFNIFLPWMPEEMMSQGEIIDFIDFAQPGDVAFFQDEEGKINHCGIVTGPRECLHTAAFTRIDKLDHHGIYCSQRRRYTHRLRIIKRIADFK